MSRTHENRGSRRRAQLARARAAWCAFALAAAISGCSGAPVASDPSAEPVVNSVGEHLGPPPEAGARPAFDVPVPVEVRLSNGLRVWLLQRPTVPMVTAVLVVPAGASADPAGQHGLAAMTASMLDEGTQVRSALEFADEVEFLGARLAASAELDASAVTLQVLRRNLDAGLDLMAEMVLQPAFAPAEFDRVKKVWLSGLQSRVDEPRDVARVVASRAFFGDAHAYAHPVEGYVASVEPLTVEGVVAFHGDHWRPEGATLVVAGDIGLAELTEKLEARFAGWQGHGEAPSAVVPSTPAPTGPHLVVVHKAEAPQTVIRILLPGYAAGGPDEPRLELLNTLFGGSFTSRIMQNLREDKGYTYGARSSFVRLRGAGYFLAYSSVFADVTGAALGELLLELGRLRAGDVTSPELERARATQHAEAVQLFETQDGAAGTYAALAAMAQPQQRLASFVAGLDQVDLDSVNGLARSVGMLDQATVVLVGDRDVIQAQLAALGDTGLPPVELRDADGRLLVE